MKFTLAILTLCSLVSPTNAFSISVSTSAVGRRTSLLQLDASKGMGMGMGKNVDKKRKKGSKKKKRNGGPSSASFQSSFDVNASLMRLEKKYDDLTLANARTLQNEHESPDDIVATEYVVAVRSTCLTAVADWVPVAQLILGRPWRDAQISASDGVSDPSVQAAVSMYCRELSHVAALGSRLFQAVPRNQLEYSVEAVDSFHKHVYEVVVEGKNDDESNDQVMTKAEARRVLELDADCNDIADIKARYRKRSFELHPDRFVGTNKDEQTLERRQASDDFARVKLAFETLSSGVRQPQGNKSSSWYASLGGRARTEFVGPLKLLPLAKAEQAMKLSRIQGAVVGLDPEMVQGFVARSQAAVVA